MVLLVPLGPLSLARQALAKQSVEREGDLFREPNAQREVIQEPYDTRPKDRYIDNLAGAEPAVLIDDVELPEPLTVSQLQVTCPPRLPFS